MKLCTLDFINDSQDKGKELQVSKMLLPSNHCIDYEKQISQRKVFWIRPAGFKDILERKC